MPSHNLLEAIREKEKHRFPFLERKTHEVKLSLTEECAPANRRVQPGTEKVYTNSNLMRVWFPVALCVLFISILLVMFRDMPLDFLFLSITTAVVICGMMIFLYARWYKFRMTINFNGIRHQDDFYQWSQISQTAMMYLTYRNSSVFVRPWLVLIFPDNTYKLLNLNRYTGVDGAEDISANINVYKKGANG